MKSAVMKKAKARYELTAAKVDNTRTVLHALVAEVSLDELKTIKRIARALAGTFPIRNKARQEHNTNMENNTRQLRKYNQSGEIFACNPATMTMTEMLDHTELDFDLDAYELDNDMIQKDLDNSTQVR